MSVSESMLNNCDPVRYMYMSSLYWEVNVSSAPFMTRLVRSTRVMPLALRSYTDRNVFPRVHSYPLVFTTASFVVMLV